MTYPANCLEKAEARHTFAGAPEQHVQEAKEDTARRWETQMVGSGSFTLSSCSKFLFWSENISHFFF